MEGKEVMDRNLFISLLQEEAGRQTVKKRLAEEILRQEDLSDKVYVKISKTQKTCFNSRGYIQFGHTRRHPRVYWWSNEHGRFITLKRFRPIQNDTSVVLEEVAHAINWHLGNRDSHGTNFHVVLKYLWGKYALQVYNQLKPIHGID